MAAVAKRWIRSFCEECGEVRAFEVRPDWALVCPECECERHLAENGLYEAPVAPVAA